ncbi:MAG: hypothetical protein M0P09_01275 [Acholeplasmataceae bacterium]|nr:hypothetical protein [Acholeplasmataceae bacterium]
MNITMAREEMFQVLQDAWDATQWPADMFASKPVLLYQGRDKVAPPAPDTPYTHIYRRSAYGEQAAFGDGRKTPYQDRGTLWILCFGPQSSGKGLEIAEFQGMIAKNAYRRPNEGECVWYRNARIVDAGLRDGLEQINVLVDYEYHETR